MINRIISYDYIINGTMSYKKLSEEVDAETEEINA